MPPPGTTLTGPDVRQLDWADAPAVTQVLVEAFHDYPVIRFVLGESPDYDRRHEALQRFFVMARVLRHEWLLGAGAAADLHGVALVARPDGTPGPTELQTLRDELWAELGADARERYEAFGAATQPFSKGVARLHLDMIGARRLVQGTGIGRLLLEAVHRLSASDAASSGVSLTTEKRENVRMYEHFGYEVVGHAPVSDTLETWGMFRPNG